MGIQADNMAEVVERSGGNPTVELRWADLVEFMTGPDGLVWINVDGVLLLRIQTVDQILIDTTNVVDAAKVIKE